MIPASITFNNFGKSFYNVKYRKKWYKVESGWELAPVKSEV